MFGSVLVWQVVGVHGDMRGVCVFMAVVVSVCEKSVLLCVCVCLLVCCFLCCGSQSVVTRCRCPFSPQLLLATLVGGACTALANGELLLLMVEQSRKTEQHSHRGHPRKERVSFNKVSFFPKLVGINVFSYYTSRLPSENHCYGPFQD